MEVPAELRRLVRLVAQGFYSTELAIVVDALMKHQCVREEALADLLRFERRKLREIIAQMRKDRLVQTMLRTETRLDGKSQKHKYYYINYKLFVNLVKYKFDLMRQRIETEERRSASRASLICQGCAKSYTDLEADRLMDYTSGELRCQHCGAVVEGAESHMSSGTSSQLLVRFNEQTEPLFALLREVENIQLAPDLLEPEPKQMEGILQEALLSHEKQSNAESEKESEEEEDDGWDEVP